MKDRTLRAMARWPDVPDLYGWLALDRHGRWLIRGERISRPQIIDTINAHYATDERGCWYFQNGPQRGFIALAYTPFVVRSAADGSLNTHTRQPVRRIDRAFLDEDGALLLACEHGPALLDEHDLEWALQRLEADGAPLDDAALTAALALPDSAETALTLRFEDTRIPVERLDSARAEERLGFVRDPQSPSS